MPVQRVELVERHEVDDLLHLRGIEEVARHVEHQPAVAEARRIVDFDARQRPLALYGGRTAVEGRRKQAA